MTQSHPLYDIIIIGAGMVGLTLACSLAKSTLQIAVIDHQLPPPEISLDTTDIRVSAITLASQHLLEKIGAWTAIPPAKITPFSKMHVWNGSDNNAIDFDSFDINEPMLGYILENRILQAALFKLLQNHPNISFICPGKLQSVEFVPAQKMQHTIEPVVLRLEDGKTLTTKLLVGADGANSKVRELANITVTHSDYNQTALIANVRTELPHQATARQRFLATGPLAFLPLSDPHWCSIVWSTLPSDAESLLKISDEDFKIKLADAFGFCLGNIEQVSQRAIFPLRMQHADHYIQPHIALIGDAAHTIHPLAGQGVNLGFQDVAALTQIILTAQEKKQAIGAFHTLRRYERWRKSDNTLMITFVSLIKRMFSSETPPSLRTMANIGLNITNKITLLKKFFMLHATKNE